MWVKTRQSKVHIRFFSACELHKEGKRLVRLKSFSEAASSVHKQHWLIEICMANDVRRNFQASARQFCRLRNDLDLILIVSLWALRNIYSPTPRSWFDSRFENGISFRSRHDDSGSLNSKSISILRRVFWLYSIKFLDNFTMCVLSWLTHSPIQHYLVSHRCAAQWVQKSNTNGSFSCAQSVPCQVSKKFLPLSNFNFNERKSQREKMKRRDEI